jgi:hypothetical protein
VLGCSRLLLHWYKCYVTSGLVSRRLQGGYLDLRNAERAIILTSKRIAELHSCIYLLLAPCDVHDVLLCIPGLDLLIGLYTALPNME